MNISNIELGMRALRKGRKSLGVACGILAIITSPATFAQQKVDTVVTNGKILTVDADFRVVEALAINDGRIVARGTSAEVARYAGPNTKVLDVRGATVIPGLIDNHFHFTRAVERWHQQARFEGVSSRREALRILAAKAASLKPGDWIMVQGGWTPRQFADAPGGFTLEELDGVAPKNPLFVQEGYSLVYANSLALKAVGLNPADGARRNAAGLVSFQPPYALYDAMPPTSPAQLDQNLTDFMHELNGAGLTGVYSLGQSKFLARQRYTLYFSLPEGVQPGGERNIEVDLAPEARRRFSDAEVRYRRAYMSPAGSRDTGPTKITRAPSDSPSSTADPAADSGASTVHRRRVAVNEDGTPIAPPHPQQ